MLVYGAQTSPYGERGTTFEVNDSPAVRRYLANGVLSEVEVETRAAERELDKAGPGEGYAHLRVPGLQKELEARGLPTEGRKDELVARLEAHDAAAADEDEDGAQ
jgi:hypothetical protein